MSDEASNRGTVIKGVFFDFYNTLARFWPPVEVIQQTACNALGLQPDIAKFEDAYAAADDYFSKESGRALIGGRSRAERAKFFARYEQIILRGVGLNVSLGLAGEVWKLTERIPKGFAVFDDVEPTLSELSRRGYIIGAITNLDGEMLKHAKKLSMARHLDIWVSASEAGVGKPHPGIFRAALAKAGIAAEEAAHVGDQIHSDVEGALAAGLRPALLDRGNHHAGYEACPRLRNLNDLVGLLECWRG